MATPETIEILLVEDSAEDRELTERVLANVHLADRLQVATDGVEALDFLFAEGAFAGRTAVKLPRLVLLDLKLPRVNGLEVLQRLKSDARTKHMPVVVLTSSRELCDVVDSYRLGVNSYVVKPVSFESFAAAIQEVVFYWLRLNESPVLG